MYIQTLNVGISFKFCVTPLVSQYPGNQCEYTVVVLHSTYSVIYLSSKIIDHKLFSHGQILSKRGGVAQR
mgnify:FL=1